MGELIVPQNGDTSGYDANKDFAEFIAEINAVFTKHPKLSPCMVMGFLFSLASDLHHSMVSNVQQTQLAQAALAKAQADSLRRRIQ